MKEYICRNNLDLYDARDCQKLATQAAKGRHLRLIKQEETAWQIELCEDNYLAWLPITNIIELEEAKQPYQAAIVTREQIEKSLTTVIAYTLAALDEPNYYLWGGTVGPNYDCSGLIQAAFASVGIWLPRDSYQQAEFTQIPTASGSLPYQGGGKDIIRNHLIPGDLIFFGEQKVTHVALYLGDNSYIHSSGKAQGRNGIGIDQLSPDGNPVSQAYYRQLWGYGRVISSYMAR